MGINLMVRKCTNKKNRRSSVNDFINSLNNLPISNDSAFYA